MSIDRFGWGACGKLAPQRCASSQRGALTAEAAVVIPVILGFALGCVWLLSLALTQARATDAAREVARVVARGDSSESALALGERIAPEGARFDVDQHGGQVDVTVKVKAKGPLGVFKVLPAPTVTASAVAAKEGS